MFHRSLRLPRRSALSVSLAVGIGLSLSVEAFAGPSVPGRHPSTVHTVTSCADDDSPGTLRSIIASASTVDADTVDLSTLTCSTITLDASTHMPAYIAINQSNLHLLGPGYNQLRISGSYWGALRHSGTGTLTIEGLSVSNTTLADDANALGGCIGSLGSVDLEYSHVDGCTAVGMGVSSEAKGGGVYAAGDLILNHSSITSSRAYNFYYWYSTTHSAGGGAFAKGNLKMSYSTISNNYAYIEDGGAHIGGNTITITSSTISSNRAHFVGGLYFANPTGTAEIVDSTISGNEAFSASGALFAHGNLKMSNSTVVFNHDNATNSGVNVDGASLTLESSILAGNGNGAGPADLWGAATTTIDNSSSHNLIIAALGVSKPMDTIGVCPKLDPLANNGGFTLTHAIRSTSPAVDAGSNPLALPFDQSGYFRKEGIAEDIGAFEWRDGTGMDRLLAAGFDGLCDQ